MKEKKKNKKIRIWVIVIAAAVLLIAAASIIFAVFMLKHKNSAEGSLSNISAQGASSYEEVIDECFNSIIDGDLENLFNYVPDNVREELLDKNGYTMEELEEDFEDLEEMLDTVYSLLDLFADDWSLSYEITSASELTGDELEAIIDTYSAYDVDVTAAVAVSVSLNVESDEYDMSALEELVDIEAEEIILIETGGAWYLELGSLAD